MLDAARFAFVQGMELTAVIGAVVMLALALVVPLVLRDADRGLISSPVR